LSWQNQKGSSNLGESASPRGEVFDRLNYAEILERLLWNFLQAHSIFEIRFGDAIEHYQDSTFAEVKHHVRVMSTWAEKFLGRIGNESKEKKEFDVFSDAMREYNLDSSEDESYEALHDYAERIANAVLAAEGYGRKIGLMISERKPQQIPFDRAFQEIEAES
jgi:hypothetical protein